MKVKVCGITNLEDALLCEEYGADAVGFIFYEKSKRYIKFDSAAEIISRLSPFTMKVGVFVNCTAGHINETASMLSLNAVQLHGDESPETAEQIKFPVIKSFRVDAGFDFEYLKRYKNATFLLDSKSDNGYGGTGEKFNWNLIPQVFRSKIILAGGVSVENLENIFNKIKPAAVDLSSSLEKEPGKKDEIKVKIFFNEFNRYRSRKWSS